MVQRQNTYLTNIPTNICNKYGLTKTLLTRRETIYFKHIMKNLFIYGNEEELNEKLQMLQFKSLFQYIGFLTNKLRAIYKIPREYYFEDIDKIVKQRRESFFKMLELYRDLNPIIILDFDRTITNKKLHPLYNYIINDFNVIINSANPQKDIIEKYLDRYKLKRPNAIYANKGKQKKIVRLKSIVTNNQNRIIFYIDDEEEYLDYGVLLTMYCYKYSRDGKIYNYTIFKK
jgi:hypothetical protein